MRARFEIVAPVQGRRSRRLNAVGIVAPRLLPSFRQYCMKEGRYMPRDDANVNQSQDVDARQASSAAGSVDAQGRADEAAPQPGEDRLPPPSSHRADTMVRAVSPEARQEMARDNNFGDQPSFTKGDNAQTIDQSRYPYTVEEMDTML